MTTDLERDETACRVVIKNKRSVENGTRKYRCLRGNRCVPSARKCENPTILCTYAKSACSLAIGVGNALIAATLVANGGAPFVLVFSQARLVSCPIRRCRECLRKLVVRFGKRRARANGQLHRTRRFAAVKRRFCNLGQCRNSRKDADDGHSCPADSLGLQIRHSPVHRISPTARWHLGVIPPPNVSIVVILMIPFCNSSRAVVAQAWATLS